VNLNLQERFLLIMVASSLLLLLLLYHLFSNFTMELIERIGMHFAEKQMLYDKARTLQPLIQEIALARQSADSNTLRKWAADEQNPVLREHAMEKMEKLRHHFRGGSYFVALLKSGNYYYNDADGQYEGRQLRYTLNPASPDDAWFFDFIKSGEDYRIKVSRNSKLDVSKIWVRVPIRDGARIVGVLGTGIDLDDFIHNVSDISQPGVTNMFINRNATIQIYNDVGHVDFPGVVNFSDHEHSTNQLISKDSGNQWVNQAIKKLDARKEGIETEFVSINGRRYLAGMIALPEVGWYDLTLLDLSVMIPQTDFVGIWLTVTIGALMLLSVLAFSLHKLVLKPVAMLTVATARIRQGDFSSEPFMERDGGEVGKLALQLHDMADSIHNTQHWLEEQIEKRTRQLADAKKMLEISLQHEKNGRETQTNLLALMAHEMRSPVAVISNTAQMLNILVQSDHPDWQPRIEKILRSIRQLTSLMDNFLTEKWLDMDKHGLDRKIGDLNQVCAEIVANFIEEQAHRPIRFEPWNGDTRIYADWELVKIAVVNLLGNAGKYTSSNADIALKILPCKADMLCIEVSDRGSGISPEIQPHIFEKFIRGQQESGVHGSGLGLYLVNWIARFHGGYTEVSSQKGQGSTFRLCLPTASPDENLATAKN